MRSVRKGGKKKKTSYQYRRPHMTNQRNRTKKHKKIPEQALEENWDRGKSVKSNLEDMGLVYDLNQCMSLPKTKDSMGPKDASDGEASTAELFIPKPKKKQHSDKKQKVVHGLEEKAAFERPSMPRQSNPEVLFCVSMMEKYGDDYKRMARDRKNYYQETPKQIERKILHFKRTHQYNAYLAAKAASAS